MLLNPIANLIPWLPEAIKTAVTVAIYALYDLFNAAGKFIVDAYNEYAIFTLHVVIIALYGKHLFSKDVKTRYHAALKTIGEHKPKETHFNDESYTKVIKAKKEHDGIVATLYSLSALVLSILITNILVPNFYQFAITERSEQNAYSNKRSTNRSPYNSYIKNLTIIHEPNTFPLTLTRQHESSKAMKKKSLNVYHLSATENTLRKMPKFNPYQTGHGVIGDTKYNRRKTKRDLRKLIDES